MKVYESDDEADVNRIKVGVAEYAVRETDALLTTSGLGSCVAVALYDAVSGVVGFGHVMLPTADDKPVDNEAKYADTAVEAMLKEMIGAGARRDSIRAKIAGGSNMLDFSSIGKAIGTKNSDAVQQELEAFGVELVGADVGGDYGRSIEFDAETYEVTVKSANEERTVL